MCIEYYFPSPNISVAATDFESKSITFNWNQIAPTCQAVQYNILSSNCGICPTKTTHTTVTCTHIPTTTFGDNNEALCIFALLTTYCGIISGDISDPVYVPLITDSSVINTSLGERVNEKVNDGGYVTAVIFSCLLAILVVISFAISIICGIFLYGSRTRSLTGAATEMNKNSEVLDAGGPSEDINTDENIAYSHLVS